MSLSTSSILGLFVFGLSYLVRNFRTKHVMQSLFFMVCIVGIFYGVFELFEVRDKLQMSATASGGVRINEFITGWLMFIDNPFFGVGLGQYGFRFDIYEWNSVLSLSAETIKRIPNNVYIEILSETGLIGFLFFFIFWYFWIFTLSSYSRTSKLMWSFGVCMFVVWFAYPTFAITFIWCAAGAALAFSKLSQRAVIMPVRTSNVSL